MTLATLKTFNNQDLDVLAKEIRQFLVENVTRTGGHLASNLGVVELTIALHRVFDSPNDKIVWDVGHQTYVHKILTGRGEEFASLRQYKGMCGFPRRAESEHDVFDVGHSTTSLSAALGIASGLKLQGLDNRVVAVIGDGAATGGMAYEALNNIVDSEVPMIVVLNDNGMSISKNVGAIHYHLTRVRAAKGYIHMKKHISTRLPRTKRFLEKLKNSMKYSVMHSAIFEELGIKYLGPIDGHDEHALEVVFQKALNFEVPVLIHVCTTKGKGYEEAEQNPTKFHGVSPKSLIASSDRTIQAIPSNTHVMAGVLEACAEKDDRIVAITAAMPEGTGLDSFAERFPNRFFDVGIAEQHAVTFAAGLASVGMRPVFAVYSTFLQRAFDQVLHDVCLQKLPVIFAIDRAGLVGADGATHHGVYDIAYLAEMPNMVCCAPATQEELRAMMQFALEYKEGPISIRYPRNNLLCETLSREIELGKWVVEGNLETVAIVGFSDTLSIARETALELLKSGVLATVVNARFIKPMDEETLQQMLGCRYVAVIEDGVKEGGLGERIGAFFAEQGYGHVHSFALPKTPLLHGSVTELLEEAGLTAHAISNSILTSLQENQHARKN